MTQGFIDYESITSPILTFSGPLFNTASDETQWACLHSSAQDGIKLFFLKSNHMVFNEKYASQL